MNERAFNSVFDTDSFEWWSDIRLFPEAGLLPRLLAGQKTSLYVLWVQISVAMAKKSHFYRCTQPGSERVGVVEVVTAHRGSKQVFQSKASTGSEA